MIAVVIMIAGLGLIFLGSCWGLSEHRREAEGRRLNGHINTLESQLHLAQMKIRELERAARKSNALPL